MKTVAVCASLWLYNESVIYDCFAPVLVALFPGGTIIEVLKENMMTVKELIEQLQQMPQDARVELGLETVGQTEATTVSLESCQGKPYVFIGDY